MNPKLSKFLISASLVMILGFVLFFWVKTEYRPTQAIEVAQDFLDKLELKQIPRAYALTVQNNEYVGKTLAEFTRISSHDSCKSGQMKYTFPFQSNGNRLRSWLAGKDVEMLEISVEFECPYPYKIILCRVLGQWKIFNFGAHAG